MIPTLAQYRDQVTLAERLSQDASGEESYGTPVTYRARVKLNPQQVRTPTGEERWSRMQIRLAPYVVMSDGRVEKIAELPSITPEAQLTLVDRLDPSGNPLRPRIVNVGESLDYTGQRQVELFA